MKRKKNKDGFWKWVSERCEWDPERGRAAACNPRTREYKGCRNKATVSIGWFGQWRLCEECAKLPAFNRFKIKNKLREDGKDVPVGGQQ